MTSDPLQQGVGRAEQQAHQTDLTHANEAHLNSALLNCPTMNVHHKSPYQRLSMLPVPPCSQLTVDKGVRPALGITQWVGYKVEVSGFNLQTLP
jgi:hypothetical protein